MSSKWKRRALAGAALTLGTLVLAGCAEEREAISRVQPNALPKSFFVGAALLDTSDDPSFFTHGFVVDQSENQSTFTVGQGPGLERVRFDITETHLIAYRAYPNSEGADHRALENPDGEIIAAFRIEQHFDIRNAYNPATGEELNVVEENTSDRPWYEREYMRVDWSVTDVVSPVWSDVFLATVFDGGAKITPASYYVSDPTDANAPHFELENGYFDVTTKLFVEPESMEMWGEEFPACLIQGLFTGTAVKSCGPSDAFVRNSFVRVDKVDRDDDFEPFENSRGSLDIIANIGGNGDSYSLGMYAPPRMSWDPGYGYTDGNFHRYMYQHNIWKQSHQTKGTCATDADCAGQGGGTCLGSGVCTVPCEYSAAVDQDKNGTDDQCENAATGYGGSPGSQCSARNRCTIPYRDRETRVVAYWPNDAMPADLLDTVDRDGRLTETGASEDIMGSWDQMFRHAVARAREVECRRTQGGSREQCHNKFFAGQEMVSFGGWLIDSSKDKTTIVTVCHNPVRAYDNAACGAPGTRALLGDVRRNWLIYWPYSSDAPYGGVVKWNSDPLTGMVVGATATTMGRSATYAAAQFRDVMMATSGDLSWDDIAFGATTAKFRSTMADGYRPAALTEAEMQQSISAIDYQHAAENVGSSKGPAESFGDYLETLVKGQKKSMTNVGVPTQSDLKFQAVAAKFIGTELEAQLVTPGRTSDLLGPASIADTSLALERVSPLRTAQLNRLEELFQLRSAARGQCFLNAGSGVGNFDVQGAAAHYAKQYSNDALKGNAAYTKLDDEGLRKVRAEKIFNDLWKDMYKGIMLHEVGHSMGMRHQFASSYDSANYLPQYWQMRTQDGKAMATCDSKPRTGDTWAAGRDTCMGPRYLDPETDREMGRGTESRPGINYFAHTSTMEYQVSRFFESVGLGAYDRLFIGATYGRVLEVFDGDLFTPDEQRQFEARHYTQLSDFNLVYLESGSFGAGVQPIHYTEQARRMKLFDPSYCREATAAEKAKASYRIVDGKVCATVPRDYAAWGDVVDAQPRAEDPGSAWFAKEVLHKLRVSSGVKTYNGNVRWPFRYGEQYSNSYVQAHMMDAGADIYEVVDQAIRTFEYDYPFNYYRRQRKDWFYDSLPGRTSRGYFDRLRALHWSIASSNARFGDQAWMVAMSDDYYRPYALAETAMFKSMAKALLLPQPGFHAAPAGGGVSDVVDDAGGATFYVGPGDGRFIEPDFDSSPGGGGSWEYQSWPLHVGFTEEKGLVARALVDGRAVLSTISRDNYLDGRSSSINFRSDLPGGMDRLLGGLLSEDWAAIGSYVIPGDPNAVGTQEGKPVLPVYATDLTAKTVTRPAGAVVVFPNIGYDQQLEVLLFSHIFAKVNTDLELARKMWIWIDGHVGEFNIPEEQQIRFSDPRSGFTYVARRYGTETLGSRPIEKGIGSRMLERANKLVVDAYEVETDGTGAVVLNTFGQPTVKVDRSGNPIMKGSSVAAAAVALNRYVGLLDTALQIENTVGYGPLE